MLLVNILLVVFWMLIVPILIGILIVNQFLKEKSTDLLLAWVCGFFIMFAVFYILTLPLLFSKISLHILMICWSTILLYLCTLALLLNRKCLIKIMHDNLRQVKFLSSLSVLVIILVLAQALILSGSVHQDSDDSFYVATATTAVATDSIFQYDPYTGLLFDAYPTRYVLSPYPIIYAVLSKVVLIHPAIIAHTVWPAIAIPFSYAIFALLGKKLFPDRPNAVMFFILFLCVLNVFGNVSIFTASTFFLFRIWQGKAVLANIVLPAILYFSLRSMSGKNNRGDWLMLLACVLTACLVSSMGIILASAMTVCLGLAFALNNKQINTFVYSIVCCTPCIACGIFSIIS